MNAHRRMKSILTRQGVPDALAFDRDGFPLRSFGEDLPQLARLLILGLFRRRPQFHVTSPGAFLRKRAV